MKIQVKKKKEKEKMCIFCLGYGEDSCISQHSVVMCVVCFARRSHARDNQQAEWAWEAEMVAWSGKWL